MSRAYCYQCQRVKTACICDDIVRISNPVSVYVLQHPDETRHAKGTAIIARLSLENYQCWQGEDFSSHPGLNELIRQHADTTCIVYPSETSIKLGSLAVGQQKQIKHLIFIDATWRKAKKIWLLSENLHHLLSVRLEDELESNYRIRKAPETGYLSTIEAISYCLAEVDSNREKYQSMLDLFDKVIDRKIDDMGLDRYKRNYNKK